MGAPQSASSDASADDAQVHHKHAAKSKRNARRNRSKPTNVAAKVHSSKNNLIRGGIFFFVVVANVIFGNLKSSTMVFMNMDDSIFHAPNAGDSKVNETSQSSAQRPPRLLMEPGRVFTAQPWIDGLVKCMFPEFEFSGDWDPSIELTPNDVIFAPLSYRAPQHARQTWGDNVMLKNESQRVGKVIFMNGESTGDMWTVFTPAQIDRRLYQLGPISHNRRDNSYQVMHMTFVVEIMGSPFAEFIRNPTAMPRKNSTREINGVLYKNSNCVGFRNEAARRMSEFLDIYHGICKPEKGMRPNSLLPDTVLGGRKAFADNARNMGKYKYCIVMENVVGNVGYVTEKLLYGLMSGCLPIYAGSRTILDVFNPKAFIYYDLARPDEALDLMRRMEANDTLYDEYNNAPIFADPQRSVNEYFSICDDIGDGSLKRRIRQMMEIEE